MLIRYLKSRWTAWKMKRMLRGLFDRMGPDAAVDAIVVMLARDGWTVDLAVPGQVVATKGESRLTITDKGREMTLVVAKGGRS